ncbi:hypothetical protein STEG23_018303, partial [Scotinomys teguina]
LQSSSCGNPGVPPKGVLYGTRFDVGDKIRYSCVTGYILDGHPQLTCIANSVNTASWDFPVPICRVCIPLTYTSCPFVLAKSTSRKLKSMGEGTTLSCS